MSRETGTIFAGRDRRSFSEAALAALSFVLVLATYTLPARAQRLPAGRGAISAQDLAKISMQATSGLDTADSVCARFAAGSSVSAPPELRSQNGVLEVTMQFLTVVDSEGLTR